MKVIRMPMGNCAVIQHDQEEQKHLGVKEFEAVFWEAEEDKFQPLTDFDTAEEASEFLDVIDWSFDYYEPKEISFVKELMRKANKRR